MDDLSPTGADQGDGFPGEGELGHELGHQLGDELGDADLVAQVRAGLDEPYAELYRRHQPAALALARTLTEHSGADDVVSEAFEKLLHRIRGGGGPTAAFRPYLLRTVRTVAVDASRRTRRLVVSENPEESADTTRIEDDGLVDAIHERTTLARAFATLPERWQAFLWLSFVDDADRSETARILGTNVGSVSALGYRAREGLRRAYLDAHLRDAPTPECAEVWPLLAGAIRGGLGPSQQAEVDEHTAGCEHCRAALAELEAVNTRFGAVLAPIVLGAAAPAYLAAVQHGGAVASAAGAATSAAAAATAGGGAEAGIHALAGHTAGKWMLAGLSKTGVAVVACVSTVALVALLAVFTSPMASELSVLPRPGTTATDGTEGTDGSRGPGSDGAGGGDGSPADVIDGTATTPGERTSPTGSGDPTASGPPTASPTGGPTGTPTASPTASPTGGPTAGPTSGPTSGPTPGPTTGPTSGPTPGPSSGGGTQPPTPDASPTVFGTHQPTPGTPTVTSSDPTPTATAAPEVDASISGVVVQSRGQASAPAHVELPVTLHGGTADLQVTVTIVGLNKFTTTSGAGEGAWSCLATTPMAGAGKTGVVRCTLPDARPGDPLALGLDIGYSGDGSLSAVLAVLGDAVDSSSSDNFVAADLPLRHD